MSKLEGKQDLPNKGPDDNRLPDQEVKQKVEQEKVREAINTLRCAQSEGALDALVLPKKDLDFLLDLRKKGLLAEVEKCGLNYEKAFGLIREATETVGRAVVREVLQSYLDELRTLLLAPFRVPTPEEAAASLAATGSGRFDTTEEDERFATCLGETLTATNLWLAVPGGGVARKLVLSNTGNWRLQLSAGGYRSPYPGKSSRARGGAPPPIPQLKVEFGLDS